MRTSIPRYTLSGAAAAGLVVAMALAFGSPPASAEGYMGTPPPTGGVPQAKEEQQRPGQQYAGLGLPSAEPRALSPLARTLFFQGRDPNDKEAVKRLGTHPGAAGM